jgi:hypothetical protein
MLPARLAVLAALALGGCNNMITGELTPVPPVHRVSDDIVGAVVLVDEDPALETKDPEHVARAMENRVPQDFRASMVRSFQLAGFRVTSRKEEAHDLVARLALAVSEEKGKVRQVYRCGLRSPDGTVVVEQVDWQWPQGTYVDAAEVFTFATNHVANEVAMSPRVSGFLRARRAPPAP